MVVLGDLNDAVAEEIDGFDNVVRRRNRRLLVDFEVRTDRRQVSRE